MLNPPPSGRRGSTSGSDRSSQPPSHADGHSPEKKDHQQQQQAPQGQGQGQLGLDGEQMQDRVKIIKPINSDCPRIAALGTLRAVGIGPGVHIVETKQANQDSEVAAASRDTFSGVGHTKFILCVAFSPDGQLVASGSGDQLVILWDVKTAARRSALIGHNSGVRCVTFSHDGLFLASASSDHNCILWDVLRGNQRAQLKGHTMEINSATFAPDSSFLFTAGVDKTIFVWDLRSPVVQLHTKLAGHSGHIHAVAASPDGNFLLSTGADRQIIVWDTKDFSQVDTITKHTRDVHCIAFSPCGTYFATGGSDALIIVWNAATFTEHTTLRGHTNRVMSVAFSPQGQQLLASASMDKSIGLWDPVKGGPMKGQLKEHGHQVYSVSFPRVATSSPTLVSGSFSSNFILWDIVRGRITASLDGGPAAKSNVSRVEWVQLSDASHRLLVRTTDFAGEELLWDAESGRTTQLDRIMEQEQKLREMDDMRIHQEKMIKLAKQRQRQEEMDKRADKAMAADGAQNGDGDVGDAFGENMESGQFASGDYSSGGGGGMSPAKLEQMFSQLPDKIAHAMAHSPDSKARGRLHSALDAGSKQEHSRDGESRLGADDRSQVSYGDHGGGPPGHMRSRSSFSFGAGAGRHGGLGGGGGGHHDAGGGGDSRDDQSDAILHAIAETREAQRATSREVADLHKDVAALQGEVKNMTAMMGEMMKLLQQQQKGKK